MDRMGIFFKDGRYSILKTNIQIWGHKCPQNILSLADFWRSEKSGANKGIRNPLKEIERSS